MGGTSEFCPRSVGKETVLAFARGCDPLGLSPATAPSGEGNAVNDFGAVSVEGEGGRRSGSGTAGESLSRSLSPMPFIESSARECD